MGQDPEAIRREIEETRGELSDTVAALGHKADVKGRAKESVSARVDAAKESVAGTVGSVRSSLGGASASVSERTPSAEELGQGARRAAGLAQENPLGLALGAVAVGFIAGLLVPSSRVESERLGPVADQVKERAAETGQEALERGRQVVGEAAKSAKETAQESGRQQAEELGSSAQEKARQTREDVGG